MERVYRNRRGAEGLYDADRPEVRIQVEQLNAALDVEFRGIASGEIDRLRFLDVGCGTGGYLRRLIELGADPKRLAGTELIAERLEIAQALTVSGPLWHLGSLEDLPGDLAYDVVSAFTVFSSILDDEVRRRLADHMWDCTAMGGAVIVYDFRYDNPKNPDVSKVTRRELERLFPEATTEFSTMTLAPPISRQAAKVSPSLVTGLGKVGSLRSHFLFIARKKHDT